MVAQPNLLGLNLYNNRAFNRAAGIQQMQLKLQQFDNVKSLQKVKETDANKHQGRKRRQGQQGKDKHPDSGTDQLSFGSEFRDIKSF